MRPQQKIIFRKMKLLWFCSAITFMLLITGICLARTPGTSSSMFLKVSPGARPVGMGEAFTAVSDDINALAWNPAGLNFFEDKEFTFTHNFWFLGVNYDYLAYAQKLNALGLDAIGVGLAMVNYGDIPRTIDDAGTYGGQDGVFSASSYCFNFSLSKRIKKEYNLGLNLKFIQESIDQYSAFAFAFDIGFLYNLPMLKGLTIGANLQNLGSTEKFVEEEFPLPQQFTIGGASKISLNSFLTGNNVSGIQKAVMEKGEILISCDLNFPFDYSPSLNIGAEYNYDKMIFARFGFKLGNPDNLSMFNLGAGYKWKDFTIDYAWVPYGNLGNSHRISFIAGF